MSEKIFEIISGVAKKSVAQIEGSINEKGLWDSLSHVEIVFALEAEYDLFFSPQEIADMDTPAKIIDVVTSKASSRES